MSNLMNGHAIVDSYEMWAVEQKSMDGRATIHEFDDMGFPPHVVTAEENARAYAKSFGGKVKKGWCFYTDLEDA